MTSTATQQEREAMEAALRGFMDRDGVELAGQRDDLARRLTNGYGRPAMEEGTVTALLALEERCRLWDAVTRSMADTDSDLASAVSAVADLEEERLLRNLGGRSCGSMQAAFEDVRLAARARWLEDGVVTWCRGF